MDIATDKSTMLEEVRNGWWRLQRALAELTQNEMEETHLQANWTVKDIIAHITFWEQNLLDWLRDAEQGKQPERPSGGWTDEVVDHMNEENYHKHAHQPIHQVLADAAEVHEALFDTLNRLPEDPHDEWYAIWPGGNGPWRSIAGNTYGHYAEHLPTIEAYLEGTGKPGPENPREQP